jgi:hypothetical protein
MRPLINGHLGIDIAGIDRLGDYLQHIYRLASGIVFPRFRLRQIWQTAARIFSLHCPEASLVPAVGANTLVFTSGYLARQ